ncbi:MAG: hypothetical protein R3F22_07490 [Lysobacteraceae bacterium]
MATRRTSASDNDGKPAARVSARKKTAKTARKATTAKTTSKRGSKASTTKKTVPKKAVKRTAAKKPTASRRTTKNAAPSKPLTGEELDRRCLRLIHAACLKAGSGAIAGGLIEKVPMLGKLAPLLIGKLSDRDAPAQIQRRLVLDILELHAIRLNELEERAVILLATAVGGSAREISQRSLELLVERSGISRLGGSLGRPIINRLLPVASLASDGATTITATYAIGRRAQALCRIGNGQAQDLGELLHGLTGIDQRRLISWSGSAFRLAISPFRAALGAVSQ